MLYVLPLILWVAISLTTFTTLFVTMMSGSMDSKLDSNKKTQYSMLAMVALGIGEMIGTIICG